MDIQQLLKQKGVRPTETRTAIIEILSKSPRISADEILERLEAENHQCDRVTVYRNLDALVEADVACTFHFGERQAVYEVRDHPHHHHLVCKRCGSVNTDEHCTIGMPEYIGDFKVGHHHLTFYGYCSECENA